MTDAARLRLPRRERALVFVEALTVGLPFCAFKGVWGLRLLHGGNALLGGALVALAVLDAVLNVLNAATVLLVGRRTLPICSLHAVALALRPSTQAGRGADVGTALDAALSFSLVALMIGSGAIGSLPASLLLAWNLAVVLNVLGAGVSRLAQAFAPPEPADA